MIFGKKPGDGGEGPSANVAGGEKIGEERRPTASAGLRGAGEDHRHHAGPARGSRLPEEKTSTLSSHLSFDGTLKFSGKVIIDCDFRGSVTTDDTLVVGSSGKLEAEVTAGIVEIAGKVRGNIKARTRVKILAGGEVRANIETPTVSMDDGVVFEGNCTRPHDGAKGEGGATAPAQPARVAPNLRKVLGGVLTDAPAVPAANP